MRCSGCCGRSTLTMAARTKVDKHGRFVEGHGVSGFLDDVNINNNNNIVRSNYFETRLVPQLKRMICVLFRIKSDRLMKSFGLPRHGAASTLLAC